MRGDEGAFALTAHEEVFGRELIDGLAHRALAHAKARGQFDLARDRFARLPLALLQTLQYQPLDLLVQRAECRRGGCSCSRRGGVGGVGQRGHGWRWSKAGRCARDHAALEQYKYAFAQSYLI
jgi:hypothetical protein